MHDKTGLGLLPSFSTSVASLQILTVKTREVVKKTQSQNQMMKARKR